MAMTKCKECGSDISNKADACPKCGAKPKRTPLFIKILSGFAILYVLTNLTHNKNASTVSGVQDSPKVKTLTELSDLSMDFEPSKSGFGNIAMINGSIKNLGPTNVKDIKIECDSFAASGTKIDTNKRTLYDAVAAGKTIKFKDFNMGFINTQVKSTSCSISGFTSD